MVGPPLAGARLSVLLRRTDRASYLPAQRAGRPQAHREREGGRHPTGSESRALGGPHRIMINQNDRTAGWFRHFLWDLGSVRRLFSKTCGGSVDCGLVRPVSPICLLRSTRFVLLGGMTWVGFDQRWGVLRRLWGPFNYMWVAATEFVPRLRDVGSWSAGPTDIGFDSTKRGRCFATASGWAPRKLV